jgi:hypothetical protein
MRVFAVGSKSSRKPAKENWEDMIVERVTAS